MQRGQLHEQLISGDTMTNDLAKLVTSPSDAYAAWAPTYPPHAHNALMEVEQTAVLELLPPVSGRDGARRRVRHRPLHAAADARWAPG